MSSDGKQRFFFRGPADRSLEAYKTWIRGIVEQLGGVDDMSDAQWEAAWRQFWSRGANGRYGSSRPRSWSQFVGRRHLLGRQLQDGFNGGSPRHIDQLIHGQPRSFDQIN